MSIAKLKIQVGTKEEDGLILPEYRVVSVRREFIKVYKSMIPLLHKLTKTELALAFHLFDIVDETGLVYNNKLTKIRFNEYLAKTFGEDFKYRSNTIDHAFSGLKKEAIIVSINGIDGGYWINPALMFVGNDAHSNKILIQIEAQEWSNEMKKQKLEQITND